MNKAKRILLFEKLKQKNQNPTTELQYRSSFELLVAVILSAQATDVAVNKATKKLFSVANTPAEILKLGHVKLKKYIRTIGLYNTKGKNIIKMCQMLITEYQGQIPEDRKQLEKMPGVGRKTANVILNTVFGHPTIAVDTHIFRIANRIGLAPGKNVLEVERQLLKHTPDQYKRNAHHWLILHGRYTCTAKKPNCATCIIFAECEWPKKAALIKQPKKKGQVK